MRYVTFSVSFFERAERVGLVSAQSGREQPLHQLTRGAVTAVIRGRRRQRGLDVGDDGQRDDHFTTLKRLR